MEISFEISAAEAAELADACRECCASDEPEFGPKDFAREALESVLAARRLPRMKRGKVGARISIGEPEIIEHRLVLPEASCQS